MTSEIADQIERLNDTDTDTSNREEAAFILGNIATNEEVNFLLDQLKTQSEPEVKQMIIHALAKINSQESIKGLVTYLDDENFETRWVTVEALGKFGSQEVIPDLITCLEKETYWNVRAAIAKVLGELGSEQAIMALVKCLNDPDFYVRKEATKALKNLSEGKVFIGRLPELLKNRIPKIAQEKGWKIRPLVQYEGVITAGHNQDDSILVVPLKIASLNYELKIIRIRCSEEDTNCYAYELHPKQAGMIPGGFKLTLLTDEGEGWPGNEHEAQNSVPYLQVEVRGNPGERIIWQTTPLPENYKPQILDL